ncbi:prephenate dehydrogenase [Rhodopirellula halodulae]|uniref:prephenate dehydrogenase n=1 Tax=Rhodopirellula halodulae TaxID=2894198 RepID=UPI001E4C4B2A|nr:prephenate dehydrogenase [Rhodopirellula sp. JC737]MCC9658259.1 prephenate dehydrogenase [Rhodopirellula sp. JC737]
MPEPSCRSVAIIGLGLLGGSVALSIRRRWPSVRLTACARSPETRALALDRSIVDEVFETPDGAANGCDLAVIATPVNRIASLAQTLAGEFPELTLTDVGSTKGGLVRELAGSSAARQFVPAHPIAGSEKSGAEHASAELFDDKPIVLTPSGEELPHHVNRATAFWRATGGRIVTMPAEEHDATLALTSHLPHLLSSLAARQITPSMLSLVGTGWLDTTRVAAGDADLWTAIVSENREAILGAIQQSQTDLSTLHSIVTQGDDEALRTWLETAKQIRLDAPT